MTRLDSATRSALRDAFFRLNTPEDVATLLQVEYRHLTFLLYGKAASSRYTSFGIKKKSGQVRTIQAPCPPLKVLQRRLNEVFQSVYRPGAAVHGFVAHKSVVSNAELHAAQRFVLNLDLKDFFPSIHFGRVRGLLMAKPYERNAKVATVLAQICCFGEPSTLPQGAPTSPVVANMICARMDSELRRLAERHRCQYSRYADDITFSTNQRAFPRQLAYGSQGVTVLGSALSNAIARNWFEVNQSKIRLQTRFERQEVTGLTTNSFVNVSRRYVRQIKAMLHAWNRHGLVAARDEFATRYDSKHRASGVSPSFESVLRGKIEFLGMVKGRSDPVYVNLVRWGRSINSKMFASLAVPEDAVWVVSDLIYTTQGTAFAVRDIGWVTVAHTIEPDVHLHRAASTFSRHDIAVTRISKRHEVAVFTAGVASSRPLPIGDPHSLRAGDSVTILGYPDWGPGKTIQATKAHVTGTNSVLGVKRVCLDAAIIKGNSGGPVLNSKGEVVGIAVKGNYTGTNQSEIVPIDLVTRLLALAPGHEELDNAFQPLEIREDGAAD